MDKESEVKESSDTDSQKAESEEYRSYVEEPGDDDGENRHPSKKDINPCYIPFRNKGNDRFRSFKCSLYF